MTPKYNAPWVHTLNRKDKPNADHVLLVIIAHQTDLAQVIRVMDSTNVLYLVLTVIIKQVDHMNASLAPKDMSAPGIQ